MKNKILTGIVLLLPLSFSMAKESTASQFCLSQPETEIAQCLADEYAKYDLKLNNNYKEIMKNLSANDKKAFKTQQIAWIKEKEKRCAPLANENGKQACLLDATALKNNQLEDKLIDVIPKAFEGDWRGIEEYSGLEVGYVLLQKGKNICGTWDYFASQIEGGYIHARLIDEYTAQSIKGCGGEKNYSWTSCDIPYKDWNGNSKISLKLCDGKFYSNYLGNENVPFSDCTIIQKTDSGSTKKIMSNEEKQWFLSDKPWINQCLNYKE